MNMMHRLLLALLCCVLAACSLQVGSSARPPAPRASPPGVAAAENGLTLASQAKADFVRDKWCGSQSMSVTVANPAPIRVTDDKAKAFQGLTGKAQVFSYGDSCEKAQGGYIQGVGYDVVLDRVLARYYRSPPRAQYYSCPTGTLFFLPWEDFRKQCATTPLVEPQVSQKKTDAQEKAIVEQLLKEANQ